MLLLGPGKWVKEGSEHGCKLSRVPWKVCADVSWGTDRQHYLRSGGDKLLLEIM